MTAPDEQVADEAATGAPVTEPQEAQPVLGEAPAPRRVTRKGTRGLASYTFMGIGAQPPERCSLTVRDTNGNEQVVHSGETVELTEAQHERLRSENYVFAEDIVVTPGG